MPAKFIGSELLDDKPHDYGQVYMLESYPAYSRLKIGASANATELLLHLSDCMSPPFFCLYVLVIAPSDSQAGRYQSPLITNRADLVDFLLEYKPLLESDGRHHLWISAPEANATLVYDKHNVIYAYGLLQEFAAHLQKLGYTEAEFDYPYPHAHNYLPENYSKVEELLHYWEWQHFPLQEVDEE
ncbi:hypothetical protein [Hymenobacter cheonanensis]|uniref:hypothetical protein n=1 Tax=Hymenobacter sp. CA2-7 TaxID=3063993 RepID=UPI00271265C6|nr:hypothetical protein [Hymenobacter sp. CA2-7]MDO7887395.1 hypothetical protein [Hymenobacter sp. CA2-7]